MSDEACVHTNSPHFPVMASPPRVLELMEPTYVLFMKKKTRKSSRRAEKLPTSPGFSGL